jgi:hypothetical protein
MRSLEEQSEKKDNPLRHSYSYNPLLIGIRDIIGRVENFKERARLFYYEVVLFPHKCPQCDGFLRMTGLSQCSCFHGHIFDPTITFQVSDCCRAKLIKKTFHYACSSCQGTIQSRFLFDERIFDTDYFREMMQESRKRSAAKREEIRRLLVDSRSDALSLMECPNLEAIPGLLRDLDGFIQLNSDQEDTIYEMKSDFNMAEYRTHILSLIEIHTIYFSDVSPILGDNRRDIVRRFITLVFMDNDQEIDVQQHGNDLLIQRRNNEAHA